MLAVVHKERRLHTRLLRVTNLMTIAKFSHSHSATLHYIGFLSIGTITTILIGGGVRRLPTKGIFRDRDLSEPNMTKWRSHDTI